eukprot:Selendium_serpulae@DN6126_c0_g1_i4.p3
MVVATMKTYLVVFPTKLAGSEKTGFTTALGKQKPAPRYLRLRPEDIAQYELTDIQFSAAKFSEDGSGIVTSTGNIAVIWSLNSIRRGKPTYSLHPTTNYIKDVRLADDTSVVVAYPTGVGLFGTQKRRAGRKTIM